MITFSELAKERYSLRNFSTQPVEPDKMVLILEAGRIAPTAHNNQPQRIMVITEAGELAKVDECTRCRYGAPAVLLVCYDKDTCWKRKFDGAGSGEVDVGIVTTHLMLAAQELGLGSCWVMYFDPVKTSALFALPENLVPTAMLPLGYPDQAAAPSPMHASRMPMDDIILK